MSTPSVPLPSSPDSPLARVGALADSYFLQLTSDSADAPKIIRIGAVFTLIAVWGLWLYATWGHWGNLTVDCGREMYVASELASGKTLYKDIWFNFGPAAPYFNGTLFRIFGARLEVLYWAGALSALGSAIFIYLAGLRLCSRTASWFAGLLILSQSFHPSMFSFPLPYSFASVYGSLVSCIFLWLAIRALASESWGWIFGCGVASAIAALLKPEYGVACYGALVLLIVIRAVRTHRWRSVVVDAALVLFGLLLFALVVRWMISLAGIEFLTQENFQSWPTSYFMRTYGKLWLATTGFSVSAESLAAAAQRTFSFFAILQGLHLLGYWKKAGGREKILRLALFLTGISAVVFSNNWNDGLRAVFFPQDMGAYVTLIAIPAWWFFWRHRDSNRAAALALLLTFAALLAFRIMLRVMPWGYSIFYDGPTVLSCLFLARPLFPRSENPRQSSLRAQMLLCAGCIVITVINAPRNDYPAQPVGRLSTDRGTILVPSAFALKYPVAIQFMKEQHARGEEVLSVPEDTSLYFLSGTHCPSRVYAFTPGLVVPGKMTDELIADIERKPVRYLIWSNRIFPEYEAPRFGVDFDQTFGNYLTAHYHRVRPLTPEHVRMGDWTAYIWERNAEETHP
jgi:hypothetical protein